MSKTFLKKSIFASSAIFLTLLLSACGQKGDLFLASEVENQEKSSAEQSLEQELEQEPELKPKDTEALMDAESAEKSQEQRS